MNIHFRKLPFKISGLIIFLIAVSLAIAFIWKWMEIPKTPDPAIWYSFPKEEVWRKFFSFSIPLIYGLFTLLYAILSKLIPPDKSDHLSELHRFRRYDFMTYALIPIFLVTIILWKYLSDWYLFFGVFYLTLVFIKTAIISKAIYQWIELLRNGKKNVAPSALPSHIRWGLFLASLLLYISVSLWINYSISTTGDEQHYLMITHSLLDDRDFDLKNNIEHEDYKRFSWVYFPKHNLIEKDGGLYSTAYNSLLCFLMLPGYAMGSMLPDYALGERLGALFTINLIAAWLLLELFLFTLEFSKSKRAAFISWVLLAFTSPFFFFSSQVYPEITGAFVFLFAVRRFLNPDFRWKGPLILISSLILISLKMRFTPIALGLILFWFIGLKWKKRLIMGSLLIVSAVILIMIDKTVFEGLIFVEEFRHRGIWRILSKFAPQGGLVQAAGGLFFDQEFGLLFYSPLYAFTLIGLPWLIKRYRKETILILLPSIMYLYAIISIQSYRWMGGWALPSRYLVVITPLIASMAAIVINIVRGRLNSILIYILCLWGIGISFILTVIPLWRYNNANGANILLSKIEKLFTTKITRFFPSFVSPAPEGTAILIAVLILFIISGFVLWRRPAIPNDETRWLSSFISAITLVLFFGIIVVLIGRTLPIKQLEAEAMEHSAGIHYRDKHRNVWVLNEKGVIWDNIVLPKKRKLFVTILAAGQSNTGNAPHMIVKIGDKVSWESNLSYARNSWLTSYYVFKVPPLSKIQPFSIELTNGISDAKKGEFCGLYVDRIEFRPE